MVAAGVEAVGTGGRTTDICWGTPGRMLDASGARTSVVPGGRVRVAPPLGSVIGGGARTMRT